MIVSVQTSASFLLSDLFRIKVTDAFSGQVTFTSDLWTVIQEEVGTPEGWTMIK